MQSDFAILDVKLGRSEIAKRVGKGERIPVTIRGFIASRWGADDGTSIEFAVDVTNVAEGT